MKFISLLLVVGMLVTCLRADDLRLYPFYCKIHLKSDGTSDAGCPPAIPIENQKCVDGTEFQWKTNSIKPQFGLSLPCTYFDSEDALASAGKWPKLVDAVTDCQAKCCKMDDSKSAEVKDAEEFFPYKRALTCTTLPCEARNRIVKRSMKDGGQDKPLSNICYPKLPDPQTLSFGSRTWCQPYVTNLTTLTNCELLPLCVRESVDRENYMYPYMIDTKNTELPLVAKKDACEILCSSEKNDGVNCRRIPTCPDGKGALSADNLKVTPDSEMKDYLKYDKFYVFIACFPWCSDKDSLMLKPTNPKCNPRPICNSEGKIDEAANPFFSEKCIPPKNCTTPEEYKQFHCIPLRTTTSTSTTPITSSAINGSSFDTEGKDVEKPASSVTVVAVCVGIAIFVCILVIVGIVVGVLICRRKKKAVQKKPIESQTSSTNNNSSVMSKKADLPPPGPSNPPAPDATFPVAATQAGAASNPNPANQALNDKSKKDFEDSGAYIGQAALGLNKPLEERSLMSEPSSRG